LISCQPRCRCGTALGRPLQRSENDLPPQASSSTGVDAQEDLEPQPRDVHPKNGMKKIRRMGFHWILKGGYGFKEMKNGDIT